MFFNREKNAPVSCPISVLFTIIEDDLALGICCDITFLYRQRKHSLGVWGDNGETRHNLRYYLDKAEFSSFNELKNCTLIENTPLHALQEPITVTECDGCYPRSTPLLEQYYKK